MDFALSELQEMLQTSARDFLNNEYPEKTLREMAQDEKGFTPELWSKMAEVNWMGLSIPEEYGGAGDFLDLMVVLEEMGRVGLIGPYFATVVLAASAIMEGGSDEQKQKFLPDIAEGKAIMTLALTEPSGRYAADAVTVNAAPDSNDFIINGTKLFVPDAHAADYIICVARTKEADNPQDGVTLFIVDANTPGITIKMLNTYAGDKQCEVVFENVKVPRESILGDLDKGWPCVENVLARAAVGTCAEMVGGAQKALELALDYAKERIAFGHPIGAFQSLQHLCADMAIDIDGSRFLTYQAGWRLNEGLPAEREVAIAKSWVNQAFRRVVNSAHQVHGAIGFTEDHILHFYTKRGRAHEFSYGDIDYHLEKLVS